MNLLRAVGYFVSTLVIYLGISLLGWGLKNMAYFFSDGIRLDYAFLVLLFSLVIGIQAYSAPEGIKGEKGQEEKYVSRQRILAIILVSAMYLALFFIPFFSQRGIGIFKTAQIIRWLGVVLCALGYSLIYNSGVTLGKQYSPDVTIQQDHQLITWGVYRYLRHPRYLGVISLALGLPLIFRSWMGLVVCLLFIVLILLRITDEELAMHNEFGTAWEAYCQRSWRLVPYIY